MYFGISHLERWRFFLFFFLFFKLMAHALDLHTNYKMRCTLGCLIVLLGRDAQVDRQFLRNGARICANWQAIAYLISSVIFFSSRLFFCTSLAPTQFLVIVIPVLFFQYFFYLFFNFELLFLYYYYYYYYYFVICRIIHSKHQTTFTGNCSQMTTVTRNCRFMC